MSGRTNQNRGVIEQLLGTVRYIVIAKNRTVIPCVMYTNFKVIHKDLPDILLSLRQKQAANLAGKFTDGWRLSHGNDQGDLPEFTNYDATPTARVNKVYANERLPEGASGDAHKFQQFQEYDVSLMLEQTLGSTKVKGSKEMSDLGATRALVDECFEHVYFSLEHYRSIESAEYGTLNPWVFVLFSQPGVQDMVRLDNLEAFKKSFTENVQTSTPTNPSPLEQTGPVPAKLKTAVVKRANMQDLQQQIFTVIFEQNNFVEVTETKSSVVRKATFNGLQVTVLVPALRKRARRGSLVIAGATFDQIFQPPQQQQPNQ